MHFRKSHVRTNKLDVQETDFSHSSTEAEIISLDEGLRMDGIPALDLWDSEPRGHLSATYQSNMRQQIPSTNTNLDLTINDHFPSSGRHSGSNTMLFVFEDNEAVIKMIITGRSPQ